MGGLTACTYPVHPHARMGIETVTSKTTTAEPALPRRFGRLRVACILLVPMLILLIGLALFLPVAARSGTVRVGGKISAADAEAIRRGVRRVQLDMFRYSVTHLSFRAFWGELQLVHTCPLVEVSSPDGKTGFALRRGRTWNGNQTDIAYTFTNSSGIWHCFSITRSERVVQQKGRAVSKKGSRE